MIDISINIAARVSQSYSIGPGARYVIWLQSISTSSDQSPHLPAQALSAQNHVEEWITPEELARDIEGAHRRSSLTGISVLGAEPFEQADGLAELTRLIQAFGLTVMIYSSLGLPTLRSRALTSRGVRMLLEHTHLLVTGPLITASLDTRRAWLGSTHQRLHRLDRSSDKMTQRDEERGKSQTLMVTEAGQQMAIYGWPEYHTPPREVAHLSELHLTLNHAKGLQWLDDLSYRDELTSDLHYDWSRDERYWSVALERARRRAVKWLLEMSGSARLPYLSRGGLRELSMLELSDELPALSFGAEAEALLGGPHCWRNALKRSWRAQPVPLVNRNPRWRAQSGGQPPPSSQLGDWALLGSLYLKLTRPKFTARITEELIKKPRAQRHNVSAWMREASPLCALLSPVESAALFTTLQSSDLSSDLALTISLICPGLARFWVRLIRAEKTAQGELSVDGWSLLSALADLNAWAAHVQCYPLGDACISAVETTLRDLTPEQFYQGSASSIEALTLLRSERCRICSMITPWRSWLTRARRSVFGDEEHLHSQLTLRYYQRWREPLERLSIFEAYGDRLVSAPALGDAVPPDRSEV